MVLFKNLAISALCEQYIRCKGNSSDWSIGGRENSTRQAPGCTRDSVSAQIVQVQQERDERSLPVLRTTPLMHVGSFAVLAWPAFGAPAPSYLAADAAHVGRTPFDALRFRRVSSASSRPHATAAEEQSSQSEASQRVPGGKTARPVSPSTTGGAPRSSGVSALCSPSAISPQQSQKVAVLPPDTCSSTVPIFERRRPEAVRSLRRPLERALRISRYSVQGLLVCCRERAGRSVKPRDSPHPFPAREHCSSPNGPPCKHSSNPPRTVLSFSGDRLAVQLALGMTIGMFDEPHHRKLGHAADGHVDTYTT